MMSRYLLWLLRTEGAAAAWGSNWEGPAPSPAPSPARMWCEADAAGSSPGRPPPAASTALWRGCLLLNAASAFREGGPSRGGGERVNTYNFC